MEEAGLAETVAQAVRGAHPHLHALLYSNILLTGEGAGWVGGCVVAWVGGWVRGWVVRIAGGEGACLQLDCSSPRQTQTVPAHDVPCCGRTRLPALPCPVLQAAQRGVRGSGIGCMPSCGRWCQTITRWVCILSLFLGGGDGGGGGGGGLACVVVHSCGHVVCLECLCLCVRPACPPAHMSAFPGTCLPIHTPAHPLAPPQLCIYLAEDPVLCAWKGAALLAASPQYPQLAVTQQEWRRHGAAALAKWDA